jgi:hypothetical protein
MAFIASYRRMVKAGRSKRAEEDERLGASRE